MIDWILSLSVLEIWALAIGLIVGMYAVAWGIVGLMMLVVLVIHRVRGEQK
jgi:hypothetical protein